MKSADTSHARLAASDFAATLRDFETALTLAPRAYVDEDFYRLEVDRIFRHQWLSVGRVEQLLQIGDYFTLDLFNEPIIVVRGKDDQIRAMSAVCRHRGMLIIAGAGNRRSFQCPYHLWTYGLDGKLQGAPGMESVASFDRNTCALPQLRTEIWEGWIFINFDPAAGPLSPSLESVRQELADFRLAEFRATAPMVYDSPWNWKVMVDNFIESYHHAGVHPETLQQFFPASGTYADDVSGPYALLHNPTLGRRELRPTFPAREGLSEKYRSEFVVVCIYPFHLFACTPDTMQYFQVIPDAQDHLTLKIYPCFPTEVHDNAEWREPIEESRRYLDRINREDIVVNTGVQKGYRSGLATSGHYAPPEKAVWQFHQWLLHRLFPAADTAKVPSIDSRKSVSHGRAPASRRSRR